ncbi:GTP 3',8-cyclase MoaA [uncultured Piscinibacter sp.]|uniref:GTP 3',8-cyclase MoaA n=1 Tax=uncultured Piscinibacter sp. TaxID=1131835 RepID=UPI00261A024B|nr:GTP 3',8-cyclase MoaA [uncultured Piscinibacter sp.]
MSPTDGGLHDRFGRRVDDLRVSITDRCDLRCCYCLPKGYRNFEDRERCLDLEQIERVVGVFAALGVGRVRLTGGEPLLRRGLVQLVGRLAALPGVHELSLSTNGTQLADQAASLRQAGIACLNVSLDSLRADRMRQITGSDVLHAVIDGLMAARQVGFDPIKLNMVLLRGVNDDEIDDMAAFCIAHGFVLRLIEAMPAGDTGPHAQSADLLPLRLRLQQRFGLLDAAVPGGGPARQLRSPDGRFSIGFVTPPSQPSCGACHRVRLSVDGRLHTCLGRDHSLPLRSLLCSGASDVDLIAAIRGAIALRPERHEFREAPGKVMRVMARAGG